MGEILELTVLTIAATLAVAAAGAFAGWVFARQAHLAVERSSEFLVRGLAARIESQAVRLADYRSHNGADSPGEGSPLSAVDMASAVARAATEGEREACARLVEEKARDSESAIAIATCRELVLRIRLRSHKESES